jgi:hypothetical protein
VTSAPRMPAASVSTCGYRGLCNPDDERGGNREIPVHDCFLL